MPVSLLPDPPSALVERVTSEADYVEGSIAVTASDNSTAVAVLKLTKPSIATTTIPSRQTFGRGGEPLREGLFGATFDHLQEPRRAPVPDLTTFCRLDKFGLGAVGQRLETGRAVLACRVVEPTSGAAAAVAKEHSGTR